MYCASCLPIRLRGGDRTRNHGLLRSLCAGPGPDDFSGPPLDASRSQRKLVPGFHRLRTEIAHEDTPNSLLRRLYSCLRIAWFPRGTAQTRSLQNGVPATRWLTRPTVRLYLIAGNFSAFATQTLARTPAATMRPVGTRPRRFGRFTARRLLH